MCIYRIYIYIGISLNGDFFEWGIPKPMGFNRKKYSNFR